MGQGNKEILIQLLEASHDVENWFAPLKIAIEGLSEEDALRRENEGTNSICEIVNHLLFYNERYLNRFKGIEVNEKEIDNDSTFKQTDLDWQATIKRLNDVMIEWKNAILECNDEKLESIRTGTEIKWESTISNIILHHAYHTGQIVQIRKQQGTWTPRNW